jgi:hypothetical protein
MTAVDAHPTGTAMTAVDAHLSATAMTAVEDHLSATAMTAVEDHLSATAMTVVDAHLSAIVMTVVDAHLSATVMTVVDALHSSPEKKESLFQIVRILGTQNDDHASLLRSLMVLIHSAKREPVVKMNKISFGWTKKLRKVMNRKFLLNSAGPREFGVFVTNTCIIVNKDC